MEYSIHLVTKSDPIIQLFGASGFAAIYYAANSPSAAHH
jgi:hypothetical protein